MNDRPTDMHETLITLTSDIVAAHVSNNQVPVDQLPVLIQNIYGAMIGLGDEGELKQTKPDHAVSVRASVKKDHIACLHCGRRMKALKRHLMADHGLTPGAYRTYWDLPADYPMVAPEHAQRRSAMAKAAGLGAQGRQKRALRNSGEAAPRKRKMSLRFAKDMPDTDAAPEASS